MEITISKIIQNTELKSILEIKTWLLRHKKLGQIFFIEDVTRLELVQPFDLYFFMMPHKTSKVNPFPISRSNFLLPKMENRRSAYLKKHFESYYGFMVNERCFFKNYCKKPFIGQSFVWFYKK